MNRRRILAATLLSLMMSSVCYAAYQCPKTRICINNQVVNKTGQASGKLSLSLGHNRLLKLNFAKPKRANWVAFNTTNMRVTTKRFVGYVDAGFESNLSVKQISPQCIAAFNRIKPGGSITLRGQIAHSGARRDLKNSWIRCR